MDESVDRYMPAWTVEWPGEMTVLMVNAAPFGSATVGYVSTNMTHDGMMG
jgi:hypothetical protein